MSDVPHHAQPVPADASPEPQDAQGEYNPRAPEDPLRVPEAAPAARHIELLAPAGGPDAGFAALQAGADAVYLGLRKFSARADAQNFTIEELDEFAAYAHALSPRRRVLVAINTLVLERELDELIATLEAVAECGADVLLLQDLGVYRAARMHFPELELHASTQMAVHNRAGAEALRDLGFKRVVLARELTLEEIREIAAVPGIEAEVFVHGSLCYAYSGLCLLSSQTLARSGNRGQCSYACRDRFRAQGAPAKLRDGTPTRRDPAAGFPFSMKDLALPEFLASLHAAGVASLKIEGRKKNALYVAAAVSYYRDLLDGRLDAKDRPAREADLQTIFSRPWTRLFVQSHRDKEVADRDTSGHRGTRIGTVEQIVPDGRGGRWLRFTTSRRLEVRDGIQVDLPDLRQPFGCAIEELRILPAGRGATAQRVFEAPAGARVEIMLPPNHAVLPAGAPVYCSSSQAVKQAHKVARPRPGQYHARRVTDFELRVAAEELKVIARTALVGGNGAAIEATVVVPGTFPAAKDAARLEAAARGAFEKLGSSAFALGAFRLVNPDSRFIPLSILNEARRACVATLEQRVAEARGARLGEVRAACLTEGGDSPKAAPAAARWSLKVDRLAFLDGFEERDWADVDEVLVEIAREPLARLEQGVARVGAAVGRERVRLALPALTRKWEEADIRRKVTALREAGWRKWEAANIAAWRLLDLNAPSPYPLPPRERGNNGPSSGVLPQGERVADLATDWSVYVVNHLAAQQVLAMGATRFALSPEDGLENVRALVSQFGARATVIVYQDTPQFLAESCAYANLIGGCPGKGNCLFENMALESDDGERLLALDYRCRTIVVNQQPYCIAPYGKELAAAGAVSLRADFVYRPYAPEDVRRVWRLLRAGESVPGTQAACFARGMT